MAEKTKPGEGERPAGAKGHVVSEGRLPVTEMLGEFQGANSPFGDDLAFPLPVAKLSYKHPEPVTARES